jgi:hypothetical protein
VLLNFFDAEITASVTIPEPHVGVWQNRAMEDLLTGQHIAAQNSSTIELTIPAMSAYLLSPK